MQEQLRRYIKLSGCVVTGAMLIGCGDLEVGGGSNGTDGGVIGVGAIDGSGTDAANVGGPVQDLGGSKLLKPVAAYLQGQNATVYELGSSAFVKGNMPNPKEALAGRTAGAAPVHPMYFFFNEAGDPLFAKPEKNPATGQFFMKGGKDLRTSNSFKRIDAKKEGREPGLLTDGARGSADYQRPIIDVLPMGVDARGELYSGVWEIVKVKVPRTFQADSVHDASELLAVAAKPGSGIQLERSGVAINCPVVDARTYVVPSVSAYSSDDLRIPQPQVELWYRKKRVDCFLANGWETLGAATQGKTSDDDAYRLFRANENDERIQTFDIDVVPGPSGQPGSLVAPVGLMFIPHAVLEGDDKYYDDIRILAGPPPRRRKSDLPGYRAVRWLWNLEVVAANGGGSVNLNTLKAAKLLDPRFINTDRFAPRKEMIVQNVATSTVLLPCLGANASNDPCKRLGLDCGSLQNSSVEYCQEKKVRYNAICGPAIAQCRDVADASTYDQSDNVLHTGDVIEAWFVNNSYGRGLQKGELEARVPKEILDARNTLYMANGRGIVENSRQQIYQCVNDDTGVGRCLLGCQGGSRNRDMGNTVDSLVAVGDKSVTVRQKLDSRCGGSFMPGFSCSDQNVCVRTCDKGRIGEDVCRVPAKMWLWDNQTELDLAQGTTCGNLGKYQGCLMPTPTQTLAQ